MPKPACRRVSKVSAKRARALLTRDPFMCSLHSRLGFVIKFRSDLGDWLREPMQRRSFVQTPIFLGVIGLLP